MRQRVSSLRLVGRLPELTALGERLDLVAGGDPSMALIAGEAGIGKSRLVAALEQDAEARGFLVLTGGCIELCEGGIPLAPLAEALRRLRDRTGREGLAELLGTAVPELAALVPDLVTDDPGGPVVLPPPGRLFELVLVLLQRLADTAPVVLVIEDLHWADRSTLDLLAFLERNLTGPVLLVGTFRSDELHRRHPLRPILAELDRSSATVRLNLAPFTRAELAEQAEAITGHPVHSQVVDELLRRSGGNPFFAEELVAVDDSDHAGFPDNLRGILLNRIAKLGDEEQAVLRLAASIGVRVDDRLLAQISDHDEGRLDEILRELVEAQLLEPEPRGDTYRFRHALLQEVVYDELLPGERRRLHARIAEALVTGRPDRPGGAIAAAALAHHWYRARNLPAALAASVDAGLAAERVYAPTEALAHHERALEIWDVVEGAAELSTLSHVDLLAHAGEQAQLAGSFDRSLSHVRAALAEIDAAANPVQAGLLHERLGRFLWVVDEDGLADHEEAVRLVPPDPPSPERARVLAGYAQFLMLSGQLQRSREIAEEAVAIARAIGATQPETHALNTLGTVRVPHGDAEGGLADLRLSLELAEQLGMPEDIGRGYVNLTHALSELGRWDELDEIGRRGLQRCRELGIERTNGVYVESNMIDGLVARGRWAEAAEHSRSLSRRLPPGYWQFFGFTTLWPDLGAFAETHEVAHYLSDALIGAARQSLLDQVAAVVALAIWEGRPADAAAIADPILRQTPEAFVRWHGGELYWRLLWAAADTPDAAATDDAARWLADLEALAAAPSADGGQISPYFGAFCSLCRAEHQRVSGSDGPADWTAAMADVDAFGLTFPGAYARYRLAEALVRTGDDRRHAATVLQDARQIAVGLGARPLLAQIDLLARRARLAVVDDDPGEEPPVAHGLSPREFEVLRHVAAGESNRQIGEALFISTKTASVHVSNILAKLQVASRGEAAAVAHRLGIT